MMACQFNVQESARCKHVKYLPSVCVNIVRKLQDYKRMSMEGIDVTSTEINRNKNSDDTL